MDLQTLLKNTSRSLYLSIQMLPLSIRSAFGLAYLLCRYADTIADTALLPAKQRLYWIEQFPEIVQTQNANRQAELISVLNGKSENPYEKQLIGHLSDCLSELKNISLQHKLFIYDVVKAVCEGMKIDLKTFPAEQKRRIHSFAKEQDLKQYCRLMGGTPGLFWSRLIYCTQEILTSREQFFEKGQQVGDALQIVNILRDTPKDLQNGRCYFPQTDLEVAGMQAPDLLKAENSILFEPIKKKWIAWGKQNLQEAVSYYRALPKTAWRVRAAVAWPILWTADTFIKLADCPNLLDATKRVKISRYTIYFTMLVTPLLLASNTLFERWLFNKLKSLP